MSNVFVVIKMCYVHNQWYDISCTTLYLLSLLQIKLRFFGCQLIVYLLYISTMLYHPPGLQMLFSLCLAVALSSPSCSTATVELSVCYLMKRGTNTFRLPSHTDKSNMHIIFDTPLSFNNRKKV